MSWICNIPRDYAKLGGLAGVAFLSICSAIVFSERRRTHCRCMMLTAHSNDRQWH